MLDTRKVGQTYDLESAGQRPGSRHHTRRGRSSRRPNSVSRAGEREPGRLAGRVSATAPGIGESQPRSIFRKTVKGDEKIPEYVKNEDLTARTDYYVIPLPVYSVIM